MSSRIVKTAKDLGATLVTASSVHRLVHSRFHRHGLTILMYHGVVRQPLPVSDWCFLDEASFRRQIEYISRRFAVVPLSLAVEMLQQGAVDKPTAAITFDDGYQNNFDVAFPVLENYGVPASIFLSTGFVDSADTIWFCHIIHALSQTRKKSLRWEDAELDLSDPQAKAQASARLQATLKQKAPAEIRSLVPHIYQDLGVVPVASFSQDSPFRILDGESIGRMVHSGLVEFGGHTETHSILSFLSPEEQGREVLGSVDAVERLTGQACRFFAYPNGRRADYNSKTLELLRERGISAALTTIAGPNDCQPSLLELQRYGVGPDLGMPMFQLLVHHFVDHFRN